MNSDQNLYFVGEKMRQTETECKCVFTTKISDRQTTELYRDRM